MSDEALRVAVAFAKHAAATSPMCLCAASVDVLTVSGVGITIMAGEHTGPICVSDPHVAALEDLQFTTGRGPCHDAFLSGVSVHAPHLDTPAAARWPSFVTLADESGIRAVFAYPMISKGISIGVLTLYQRAEGDLTSAQHDDALKTAAVLAETVLALQEAAPDGTLAASLDDAVAYRAEIYQASGIVAVQLKIPVAEALLRIRAHAFGEDQPVAAVAASIVAHTLRLIDDRDDPRNEVQTHAR